MKIYLAARYTRREEMRERAIELEAMGHKVTSRWINGSHGMDDDNPREAERFALEDFADLLEAGVVVSFTEAPRSGHSRGGRHVEFGMAVAVGKTTIVVGHRENVFHCLPWVVFYETWDEAKHVLRCLRPAGSLAAPELGRPITLADLSAAERGKGA